MGGIHRSFAEICVNNKTILAAKGEEGRGINLVVFDETTGEVCGQERFDTHKENTESDRFAHYIDQLPD